MKIRDKITGRFVLDEKIHVCPDCGEEKSPQAKVCVKCIGKYREKPENYENRLCKHCGKPFRAHVGDTKRGNGKYCCRQCYLNDHPPRPNRRNGKYFYCETCGKEIYRVGAEQNKNVRGIYFCSSECYYKYNTGENHTHFILDPNLRKKSRRIIDNVGWREDIFKRDNYTCRICGVYGGKLNAHHIRPWREYPDLRFNIDNGITVCKGCHYKMHKREEKYIESLERLVKQQKGEQKCLF